MLDMNVSGPNLTANGSQSLVGKILALNAELALNASANKSFLNATMNASGNASLPIGMQQDMPSAFFLRSVLACAIVANMVLYIAPITSAIQGLKDQVDVKSMGKWLTPTYLIFAQSYLWACYGFSMGLTDIARFNGAGAAACALYMCLIARCARPRDVVQPIIVVAISAMLAFSVVIAFTWSSFEARSSMFGYAAILFNLALILAPLPDAIRVMQTGELEDYPFGIRVGTFLSSLLWAEYCTLVHDHMYLIPNLVGAIVCAVELVAIYWSVWGGGSLSSAERLLGEVDAQPLMPRARGKTSGSSCGVFFPFWSSGRRSRPKDIVMRSEKDFGLDDHQLWDHNGMPMVAGQFPQSSGRKLWEEYPFGTFNATTQRPMHESIKPPMAQLMKSPFSDTIAAEGLETFAEEAPNFDRQSLEAQAHRNDSSGTRDDRGSVDCIL